MVELWTPYVHPCIYTYQLRMLRTKSRHFGAETKLDGVPRTQTSRGTYYSLESLSTVTVVEATALLFVEQHAMVDVNQSS